MSTLSGGGTGAPLTASPDIHLEVRNLTLTNGSTAHGYGALLVGAKGDYGTLVVEDCVFRDSSSVGAGGGIHVTDGASAEIYRSTFSGLAVTDTGYGTGGAIYASFGATLYIEDSTFSDNLAGAPYGGAISAHQTDTTLVNCTFDGNFPDDYGVWDSPKASYLLGANASGECRYTTTPTPHTECSF